MAVIFSWKQGGDMDEEKEMTGKKQENIFLGKDFRE